MASDTWTVDDVLSSPGDFGLLNKYPKCCYEDEDGYHVISVVCSANWQRGVQMGQQSSLEFMYRYHPEDMKQWTQYMFRGKAGIHLVRLNAQHFTGDASLTADEFRDRRKLRQAIENAVPEEGDKSKTKCLVERRGLEFVWIVSQTQYMWVLTIDKFLGFARLGRAGIVLKNKSLGRVTSRNIGLECMRLVNASRTYGPNLKRLLLYAKTRIREIRMQALNGDLPSSTEDERATPTPTEADISPPSTPGNKRARTTYAGKTPILGKTPMTAAKRSCPGVQSRPQSRPPESDVECTPLVYGIVGGTETMQARERLASTGCAIDDVAKQLTAIDAIQQYLQMQLSSITASREVCTERLATLEKDMAEWNRQLWMDGHEPQIYEDAGDMRISYCQDSDDDTGSGDEYDE